MQRRDTLKTIGGIGLAGVLGAGATGSVAATDASGRGHGNNPGRVGSYNGNSTKTAPGLGGFDRVLLYLADPDPDWEGEVSAERFQEALMGRSVDEAVADRNDGVAFFEERYGLEFPEADEDDVYEPVSSSGSIDATLRPTMLSPGTGYTAYVFSGKSIPNTHGDDHTNTDPNRTGKVRDGGWWAFLDEDTQFGGEYGEINDEVFPAGTIVLWGDYNIRMGDREDPTVIHYDSDHPVTPGDASVVPRAFNCRIEHDEWGEGAVRGVSGGDMVGIRNVLTFPASL
ncbi:MAG: hypothetical protein R6U01_10355 [Halorubrum sp.]|uniref:hypothetical protein n=1 Tax=Halorubrum sp. TaxID=1879286 RepID=UPI0039706CBC